MWARFYYISYVVSTMKYCTCKNCEVLKATTDLPYLGEHFLIEEEEKDPVFEKEKLVIHQVIIRNLLFRG